MNSTDVSYVITHPRVVFVYEICDRAHKGLVKVSDALVAKSIVDQGDEYLKKWIKEEYLLKKSYTKDWDPTKVNILGCINRAYKIVRNNKTDTKLVTAQDIYDMLDSSTIAKRCLHRDEDVWYETDWATVLKAADAIEAEKDTIPGKIGTPVKKKIIFRPEQADAIKYTVDSFKKVSKETNAEKKKGKNFLWNAKMRFGKTLSGLEVAKKCGFKSILIVTHRPVVDKGWSEDFDKIFEKNSGYVYATRMEDDDTEKSASNHITNITLKQFENQEQKISDDKERLVLFVSMQYLRLAKSVGGKEKKEDPLRKAILEYDWELVMIDEAHEGTESAMGKEVLKKLKKPYTCILSLSGTPFNLLDQYESGQIYTWDYVMEQRAKAEWEDKNYGDPNPYLVLPHLNIYTFNLDPNAKANVKSDEVFRFHEFFRTWTGNPKEDGKDAPSDRKIGVFVHEEMVKDFLLKLVTQDENSLYPFSRPEFCDKFRHTFWVVPGVASAAALEKLMKSIPLYKQNFEIVNVAGDGSEEDEKGEALKKVQDAIANKERTITLSCGKLTTGVSVPEWTAVFCLKGSEHTPASTYMQTIFRVQTHAVLDKEQKAECYVFDFAPDRTLTAIAETSKMAVVAAKTNGGAKNDSRLKESQQEEEEHLSAFLKLCPVVCMEGAEMRLYKACELFEKLKDVYIERAVRSGYADNSIYNVETLLNLTPEQERLLGDVKGLLGSMPNMYKPSEIEINGQDITALKGAEDVQYVYYLSDSPEVPASPTISKDLFDNGAPMPVEEEWLSIEPEVSEDMPYCYLAYIEKRDGAWKEEYTVGNKPFRRYEKPDPDKEKEKERRNKENQEKRNRISVLRGVAIRIPLLVYGAEIEKDEDITIDSFTQIVDQPSWDEYMPNGFTKEIFEKLKDCFDRSIFTGAATRIRNMVREADALDIEDRINKISQIFSYFHNPDKETVLTPWRVVNMHMADTLGGYCFLDDNYSGPNLVEYNNEWIRRPRLTDPNGVAKEIFGDYNTRILEINSKTGLYPLYVAYSVFKMVKQREFEKIGLTPARIADRQQFNDAEWDQQIKDDLMIWDDVLRDNIFVVCRTEMAVSITKRTLAGFRAVHGTKERSFMNVKCYTEDLPVELLQRKGVLKPEEAAQYLSGVKTCDMIDVLRVKPELFKAKVVKGNDFWHVYNSIPTNKNEEINNMKFNAIVGNPPYQGVSSAQLYPHFYLASIELGKNVSLIFPTGWQKPCSKRAKGLAKLNTPEVKNDSQIVSIHNIHNAFPGVQGAGEVNLIYWREGYDNELGGEQWVQIDDNAPEITTLLCDMEDVVKPSEIIKLDECVKKISSVALVASSRSPYGLNTDAFENMTKHGKPNIVDVEPIHADDIKIYGKYQRQDAIRYVRSSYPLKEPNEFSNIHKWKVFVPYAWGNMDEKSGNLGGAYGDIIIGHPNEVCTQTYITVGSYDTEKEARYLAKFIMTRFTRALLYVHKNGRTSAQNNWISIPLQDFNEEWWNEPIEKLEIRLFDKYSVPQEVRNFVLTRIQKKSEENIIG